MLILDEKEQNAFNEILKACYVVNDLSGCEEQVEYYFEVYPGSIGRMVKLVVPKYGIKQDITDYSNW